jgi:capsular exopolysaccharide synthesis family protein
MSRIFDALQRSGLEQTGVEYPDLVSVATEVFETPPEPAPENQVLAEQPEFQSLLGSMPEASGQETATNPLLAFPSLDIHVPPNSRLIYFTAPDSLAAEKFRFLGVRLRQLRQGKTLKKVLITSTIAEEGKSLVSANLAGVLARRKERVLLIEGDMRRPTLAPQFGLGGLGGLAEWLQNGQRTASNVYHLRGPDFWLMPAGDPPANPLELIQSGRLSQLMEELAPLFDWVIIDSPPLLPLADTTVWSRLADGILLVVREGKTERKPLQRGLEILKKTDLLGVVLNGCSNTDHENYYQRYSRSAAKPTSPPALQ